MTTEVVSSNPAHDEVNSIQLYMIKFVGDLRQVGGFLDGPRFLHQTKKKDKKTTKNNNRPAQYNWNIVVNGVKHHNTDLFFMVYHAFLFTYTLICYMSKTRTIGGVIGSVLASSAVYCGFEPRSGQTKHYKFGFCCFCTNT